MLNRLRGLSRLGWICAAAAMLVLGSAPAAHALQTHAYEGLYLHQIAHLFFLAAMLFFALGIQQSRLARHRSWRLMAAGAWLLVLWNLWAFGGHFVEMLVPEESLLRAPGELAPRIVLASWREIVYFIVKMDNLLAVPAIFCFYFGMRGIYRALDQGTDPTQGGSA